MLILATCPLDKDIVRGFYNFSYIFHIQHLAVYNLAKTNISEAFDYTFTTKSKIYKIVNLSLNLAALPKDSNYNRALWSTH